MTMKTLEKTVMSTWGDTGKAWLEALPGTIDSLVQHWQLTEVKLIDNMSYHYVATAIQAGTRPVVLKIGCDSNVIMSEYNALQHYDGVGAVTVYDVNEAHNALLLQQVIPGNSLLEQFYNNKDVIAQYAEIVKSLHSTSEITGDFPVVNQWCEAIDRLDDPRVSASLVVKAKELTNYLLTSATEKYLCHGDLHLDNVLQHDDGCLAIDPKGIVGEIAFEVAAFDLLTDEETCEPNVQNIIIDRVEHLSETLSLSRDRLLAWFFVRAMISTQWFIEDNGDPTARLTLAELLYELLKNKFYHKDKVAETYEVIADWYDEHRSRDLFEKPLLDKVISMLPAKGKVLDLGCGTGLPIAAYFVEQGFAVTGVEGSKNLLAKAQQNIPTATLIHGDMRTVELDETFDCIIAWHSFFHLPENDQRNMFKVFAKHLKSNGIVLFTSGPEVYECWSDNGGEMLYHASLSPDEYRKLLAEHGFELIEHAAQAEALRGATYWLVKRS